MSKNVQREFLGEQALSRKKNDTTFLISTNPTRKWDLSPNGTSLMTGHSEMSSTLESGTRSGEKKGGDGDGDGEGSTVRPDRHLTVDQSISTKKNVLFVPWGTRLQTDMKGVI